MNDIGTQLLGQHEIVRPDRGRDLRAQMPGQLYRDRADAARAGMDQHALARPQPGAFDQHLPGRERHERQRSRLGHAEGGRLECQVRLRDRDALGEVLPMCFVPARPKTSSPTLKRRVAGPTAMTVPARSWPRTSGIE